MGGGGGEVGEGGGVEESSEGVWHGYFFEMCFSVREV